MLMKEHIAAFTSHITEAMTIGEKFAPHDKREIRNVLVTGLGGSGIGGTIVAQVCDSELQVPFLVSKDYFIPGFVNKHTLVIASSYSGNTEETLQALEAAQQKGALIVCVTSGGKVAEIAKKNNYATIMIPGGMPPRSAFGFSATQLFYVLQKYNLISDRFIIQLKAAVVLIDSEEKNITKGAMELARNLMGKIPVIYSVAGYEGVSIRFRQQVDENAKMLCWHHVFPEMNHNELVGWTEKNENLSVLIFLDKDEYTRNLARVDINRNVITKHASSVTEIYSKGNSVIEKAIYFIHLGDWISIELAALRGVDAVEVNVINHLKSALSKI